MTDVQQDAPKAFDAAAFAVAEDATAEIELYDSRKAGTGIFITLYSRDSERARMITLEQMNRRFKQMGKRGGVSLTAEEVESENMDLAVGLTKAWRTVLDDGSSVPAIYWNGKALDCTAANVRMFYSNAPAAREQVEDGISDRPLFTKR